ncbi:MAG: radical SAM family heme chaperone HemW [Eubacteriales bacterium]
MMNADKIQKSARGVDNLGIYIHVPFCARKCNYCDFYSCAPDCACNISEYIDALCKHIKAEAPAYRKRTVDTVFIGGGTPSLVLPKDFEKLAKTIWESFNLTQDAEFSMEANPGTLSEEKLRTYKNCGVNRLSIGLQSADDEELETLGRIHTFDDFKENFLLARRCGFDNINVDIMYGLPDESIEKISKTLYKVSEFSPEHISAYCLKIEENTPFFDIKDTLSIPDDDKICDTYLTICDKLKDYGYEQYEISNFSKTGYRCRHNLKYWNDEEYIGFGPSAHSFFNGRRYFYDNSTEKYVSSLRSGILPLKVWENKQKKSNEDDADEYIMLKMRLFDGIDTEEFFDKFGVSFEEYTGGVQKYILGGYMEKCAEVYRFTPKGFFVSNFILSDILHFNNK